MRSATPSMANSNAVTREVLLSFWKVHILHHAASRAVYGQWIMEELRRHRYNISPGTVYPLIRRMEKNGWLKRAGTKGNRPNARKEFRLTTKGTKILKLLRKKVVELYLEVVSE